MGWLETLLGPLIEEILSIRIAFTQVHPFAEYRRMDRGKGEEGSINYGQGGYHPVEIGDFFNKYVVQSKLGCDTSSTVWLAWDTQLNKYVALKITRSNTSYTRMAQVEIGILKKISQADTKGSEGDNLKTLLKHNSGKGLPLHMVKKICFHILGGLRFLHDEVSIAHADLKPKNILLPSTIDPEKDPKKLGVPLIPSSNKDKDPKKGKSVALDEEEEKMGVEAQAVQERTLSASLDLKCKIADLGNAFQTNRNYSIDIQCTSPVQTSRYNCLEIFLMQSPLSKAVDIWSVACIAFELATGDFLFKR
ncbi:uncharacterized protein LOC131068769 [Cryptomeria japonica]|uniref:uncharacterized protein LOC131068769 n=1 Tax=Cryptomeria japonica TaxID=3369 RepID=UPI0027DA0A19|nr:uncharacterized protein LOC131068769 [Cryptomeria japonica]